jgi:hypothetical protein
LFNALKEGHAMLWILIALFALAYTFVQVGSLSVMTKVLTVALLGAALVIVVLVLVMLWRDMFSRGVR